MAVDTRPYLMSRSQIQRCGNAFSGYGRHARILYQRRSLGRSPDWSLSGLTRNSLVIGSAPQRPRPKGRSRCQDVFPQRLPSRKNLPSQIVRRLLDAGGFS